MEYIEVIGWIAIGFIPTLVMLEYATRTLVKRRLTSGLYKIVLSIVKKGVLT